MSSYCDQRNATLDGKVCIVTGASSGIGMETARELARRGARVILACRSEEKGTLARDDIIKDTGNRNVHIRLLNLANLASVRCFADNFINNESRLDILVNNAGVFTSERKLTDDNLELDFGVNHIGHFLLTNLLLGILKSSAPSRVVTVTSKAHEYSNIDFEDLQTSRSWTSLKAYGRSKTANILFTVQLSKIIQGTGVTSYCVHPGVIATDLGRDFDGQCLMECFRCVWRSCNGRFQTPAEGARTTLHCCLEPSLAQQNGLYYSDCKARRPKSHAIDERVAERLWSASAELCNLHPSPSTPSPSPPPSPSLCRNNDPSLQPCVLSRKADKGAKEERAMFEIEHEKIVLNRL